MKRLSRVHPFRLLTFVRRRSANAANPDIARLAGKLARLEDVCPSALDDIEHLTDRLLHEYRPTDTHRGGAR